MQSSISIAKRLFPERATFYALLSGLFLSFSFSRYGTGATAWFSLIPLLLVMRNHPFRTGFAAGVGFFGMVLYWVNIVMVTYGKMHIFFSVCAYSFLVFYLALFFGASTWAACRVEEKVRIPVTFSLPVFWAAFEFIRSFLLTGFPWASLGYSQQDFPLLIQSVDLFGVYGLGFLIVLVNVSLAEAIRALRRKDCSILPRFSLIAALALFIADAGYGYWRLYGGPDHREKTLQTVLVQGNIDQSQKWDPSLQEMTVDLYGDLSRSGASDGRTDLIIWPESATPFYFQEGGVLSDKVFAVSSDTGAPLLFGSPAYEIVNRRYRFLNSAFLLAPNGKVLGRSDKIHLVPFGEYVPLHRFLPFIDKLVVGIGDFSPGTVTPLPLNGGEVGVLVCYESIFPELAREWVRRGSDLLVNITNDAWFGRSSAPWQHLTMCRFRAIENRIWIARAANTGISAFIAPSGRVVSRSDLFETTYLKGEVGFGALPTFYNRTGDMLPSICLLIGLWWLVKTRRRFGEAVRSEA